MKQCKWCGGPIDKDNSFLPTEDRHLRYGQCIQYLASVSHVHLDDEAEVMKADDAIDRVKEFGQ